MFFKQMLCWFLSSVKVRPFPVNQINCGIKQSRERKTALCFTHICPVHLPSSAASKPVRTNFPEELMDDTDEKTKLHFPNRHYPLWDNNTSSPRSVYLFRIPFVNIIISHNSESESRFPRFCQHNILALWGTALSAAVKRSFPREGL